MFTLISWLCIISLASARNHLKPGTKLSHGMPGEHPCQIVTIGFRGDYVQRFLHGHIGETGGTPSRPCVLTDQICFSYYCRRSPSDHFYQTILVSEEAFLAEKRSHYPPGPYFDQSNLFSWRLGHFLLLFQC